MYWKVLSWGAGIIVVLVTAVVILTAPEPEATTPSAAPAAAPVAAPAPANGPMRFN